MSGSDETTENEIVAAAKDLKERCAPVASDATPGSERKGWPIATVAGIGIGSTALAAALIYANRGTRKKK
jgi:hypothetical protein